MSIGDDDPESPRDGGLERGGGGGCDAVVLVRWRAILAWLNERTKLVAVVWTNSEDGACGWFVSFDVKAFTSMPIA